MNTKYLQKLIVISLLSCLIIPLFGCNVQSYRYPHETTLDKVDASILGDNGTQYAGFPVSSNGDVNGDGIDDILVGSDNGAFLFFGRQTGWSMRMVTSSADVWFNTPLLRFSRNDLAIIGDVNCDGYDDIAMIENSSVVVILGKPTGWKPMMNIDDATQFSFINTSTDDLWYVTGVGDVNGDACDDFVIAPGRSSPFGPQEMFLIFGKKEGWAHITDLNSTEIFFTAGQGRIDLKKRTIIGGGDINGDGFDDILFKYDSENTTLRFSDRMAIFFGMKNGWTGNISLDSADAFIVHDSRPAQPNQENDNIDGWMDIRGDYNGDGIEDVLIGSGLRGACSSPEICPGAYVIFGKEHWPNLTDVADSDAKYRIQPEYAPASICTSSAGDVNGDGFDDILIGHQWYGKNISTQGAAYLILGKPSGWTKGELLDSAADSVFLGEMEGDGVGEFVDGGGDVNGDGLGDILISSQMNHYPAEWKWSGQVYIVLSKKEAPYSWTHSLKLYSNESYDLPINSVFFGDKVWIELKSNDSDNQNINSAYVRVVRGSGLPDNEPLKLTETGRHTGTFRGAFTLSDHMDTQNGLIGCLVGEKLTFETIQQPLISSSLNVTALLLETDNYSGMVRLGNPYTARFWERSNYNVQWNFTTNAEWLTWDPIGYTVHGFQNDSSNLTYFYDVRISDGLEHSDELNRTLTTDIGMTTVRILSPTNGSKINMTEAQSVALKADGPGNSTNVTILYRWFDNGRLIAVGNNATVKLLLGDHTLELKVNDSWKTVSVSVSVTVVEPEQSPPADPVKSPSKKENGLLRIIATLSLLPILLGIVALTITTEVGKYGSVIALSPLYSKTRTDALLDNFKRGQIYRLIVEHPGVHYSRILSELEINNGTAAFHLKKLEKDQFIISRTDGFRKRFYPSNKSVPSLPSKFERIAVEIRLHPGITQKELSKELDIPPSTVNMYIKKMEAVGLVSTIKEGKTVQCYLNEDPNEK